MGNSQTVDQFPKHYVQIKREQHSILGNISYILNKDTSKKYILCQRVFMVQSQYNMCNKKMQHRKQLMSGEKNRMNKINKHMINVLEIKCSQFNEICGKIFKINIFIQQFQSDLKKQFNQRRYKSQWFSEKAILQILQNATNSLITLYDNNIKSYHLSLDSIVSINGIYKVLDSDLTSKPLPIYDFLYQSKLKKGIYLSPQHIQLDQQFISDMHMYYQNPKSDIFTLGILILELMSLSDMFEAYDYTHKKIYFEIIQNRIKQLESRYSSKLIRILRLMINQEQASRIGLLGLKQMLQNKRSSHNYKPSQIQNESTYQNIQNKQQQQRKEHKKLEQRFNKIKGQVQRQSQVSNSNYNQKRRNSIQNNYHRLYNNKLTTSRSKKSNSYCQKSQIVQNKQSQPYNIVQNKQPQPYKIISYTKFDINSNQQKQNPYIQHQNPYIQHVKVQRNNNLRSNDQMLSMRNYDKKQQNTNTNNNYYTGNKQAILSNQFQQHNNKGNEFSKNSRLSHQSDMPVSPITNTTVINNKQSQLNNVIIKSHQNYNNNKFDQNYNKKNELFKFQQEKPSTIKYATDNNFSKQTIKGNYNYQSFQNHQQNLYKKDINKSIKPQIFYHNLNNNNTHRAYYDKYLNFQDQLKKEAQQQHKFKSSYLQEKSSVQTPKNTTRKNIYSINTKQFEKKLNDVVDSNRSTPVKHLQLIQTNKKQYQQMSKTTFGRYDFSNGAVYEGQFNQNNQFEGNGVLYYPNGKICYSGGWLQNCFHSFGVLYNQQIITQTPTTHKSTNYKDFNKNDSNNWIQYEGEFVQDKKNGFGSLLMSNGDKFSGCFVNDIIQGFGTFYIKSTGQSVNGIWLNNILQK